mgnify:CR=1 FL=1
MYLARQSFLSYDTRKIPSGKEVILSARINTSTLSYQGKDIGMKYLTKHFKGKLLKLFMPKERVPKDITFLAEEFPAVQSNNRLADLVIKTGPYSYMIVDYENCFDKLKCASYLSYISRLTNGVLCEHDEKWQEENIDKIEIRFVVIYMANVSKNKASFVFDAFRLATGSRENVISAPYMYWKKENTIKQTYKKRDFIEEKKENRCVTHRSVFTSGKLVLVFYDVSMFEVTLNSPVAFYSSCALCFCVRLGAVI